MKSLVFIEMLLNINIKIVIISAYIIKTAHCKTNQIIFYIVNLSEVNTHLLAAIFIDSRAICYAVMSVWAIRALAAHSANCPPEPTPMVSLISRTLPVPSN